MPAIYIETTEKRHLKIGDWYITQDSYVMPCRKIHADPKEKIIVQRVDVSDDQLKAMMKVKVAE